MSRTKRTLAHFAYFEVTLEFSMNDDAPVNLSEMRFHIPGWEVAQLFFLTPVNIPASQPLSKLRKAQTPLRPSGTMW